MEKWSRFRFLRFRCRRRANDAAAEKRGKRENNLASPRYRWSKVYSSAVIVGSVRLRTSPWNPNRAPRYRVPSMLLYAKSQLLDIVPSNFFHSRAFSFFVLMTLVLVLPLFFVYIALFYSFIRSSLRARRCDRRNAFSSPIPPRLSPSRCCISKLATKKMLSCATTRFVRAKRFLPTFIRKYSDCTINVDNSR